MATATLLRWRLHIVMAERRMNNRELAKLIGVHETTISRLKNSDTVPSVSWKVMDKLCAALQCQPGDLVTHEPDEGDK